jgi:hypothetical protein
MNERNPITADDVDTVISCLMNRLRPAVDADWSVPAGTLEWSCWATAEHLGGVFAHYGSQLAIRARTRYVRWAARAQQPTAPPAGVVDFLEGTGRMFAMVVRGSASNVRIFHPYGLADPEGMAGGVCIEALIHGNDIASGLGLQLDPPIALCDAMLARMWPHLPDLQADSWTALQWATGRIELPGRPHVDDWKWRATPLDEPWIIHEPDPRPF